MGSDHDLDDLKVYIDILSCDTNRYDCRKSFADKRFRVGGRFVSKKIMEENRKEEANSEDGRPNESPTADLDAKTQLETTTPKELDEDAQGSVEKSSMQDCSSASVFLTSMASNC